MRAFMSRRDSFLDRLSIEAIGTAPQDAECEVRAILDKTESERGAYVACYASLAYLRASRMPLHKNITADLVEALTAFVNE